MAEETRIIKKYPNRRLYDTAISHYITLNDIRQLVLDCVDFRVIDARTEEDLTNNTLLQIIVEQEDTHMPFFTREILQNVIRFYGDSMQDMLSHFIQQSMALFMEQQSKLKEGVNTILGNNPFNMFADITERNLSLWRSMQENFFKYQQTENNGNKGDKGSNGDNNRNK